MAAAESRLNLRPEASNLGGLGWGPFLAQRCEAGSSVLALGELRTLYDASQQKSTKVNGIQQGQQVSTEVNALQQSEQRRDAVGGVVRR